MSNIIKLKRGLQNNLPSDIKEGEIVITTDSNKLYSKNGEINPNNVQVSNTQPTSRDVNVWINPSGKSDVTDLQNKVSTLESLVQKLQRKNSIFLYNVAPSSDYINIDFAQTNTISIPWNRNYQIGEGFTVDSYGCITITSDKFKTIRASASMEYTNTGLFQLKLVHNGTNGSTAYSCQQPIEGGMNHSQIASWYFRDCKKGDTIIPCMYTAKATSSCNVRDRRHVTLEVVEYWD